MKRFRNILLVTNLANDHCAALARTTGLATTDAASLRVISIFAEDFRSSRKTPESLLDLIVTEVLRLAAELRVGLIVMGLSKQALVPPMNPF